MNDALSCMHFRAKFTAYTKLVTDVVQVSTVVQVSAVVHVSAVV